MNFPIQPVPQPRQTQPFQQPLHYDPASIIMQAAALRQQRDLMQQRMQLESVQGITSAAQAVAGLMEQKRQHDMQNQMAQATLEMARSKAPLENALLSAHAAFFGAQANLFGPGGNMQQQLSDMLYRETLPPMDPRALPPGTTANSMPKMGIARAALVGAYANNPNAGISQAALNYQKASAEEKAAGGAQSFNIIQTTNSVLQQLKILGDINNSASRSQFSLINRKGLGAAASAGDPLANAIIGQSSILSQTEQRLFPNSSDQRFNNIQSMLSPMASQKALGNQIRLMYTDYVNGRNFRAQQPAGYLLPDEKKAGLYIDDMPSFVKQVAKQSQSDVAPGSYLMNLLGHLSGTGTVGQSNNPTESNTDMGGALMELQRRSQ